MNTSFDSRRLRARTVAWLAALVCVPSLFGLFRQGMDANWDLRNYHLYNPHAWLTGRDSLDVAAAQLQSFHNPLLDVPLYLLVSSGAPTLLAGLWLLLPTMACLALLLRLQRVLSPAPPERTAQVVLVLLAISGAATWSMLASSMNDPFVAAAMLASLALVVNPDAEVRSRHWLLAGALAGAMAGLKLTASFYCFGLAASALVGGGSLRLRLTRLGLLALGGIGGAALTFGYWGWHLYQLHGNPVFPYFNHVFASPDAMPWPWTDNRFRTRGAWDALTSPFQLLRTTRHFSEIGLRDPRLLGAIAGLALLWALARRRDERQTERHAVRLLVFLLVSWMLWCLQYGIYRYAMTLELLGALAMVSVVARLPKARVAGWVLLLLVVSADTRRPDWNRTKWSASLVPAALKLPDDALVVTASGEPLAYLALALPPTVPMIGLSNNLMSPDHCPGLQARAEGALARHRGPVYLLAGGQQRAAQRLLERNYGLRAAGTCQPVAGALEPATLCPQKRLAQGRVCASETAPAQ